MSDLGSDNEQMLDEKADSKSSDVVNSEEGGSEPETAGRDEYLENKMKNVAELQKKLEEVKAQFPIPGDPISGEIVLKQAPKRPVSKKAPSHEPVIRRESQRNKDKDKRWFPYCDLCDDLLTTRSLFSVSSASELTKATTVPYAVEELPQPANASATPNIAAAPALPISPAKPLTGVQHTVIEALHDNSAPTVVNDPEVGLSPAKPLTVVQNTVIEALHDNSAPTAVNDPEVGQSVPSVSSLGATCNVDFPSDGSGAVGGGNTDDVVMQDATLRSSPPLGTRNDEDLPRWLTQMAIYLRGVSEEATWQDLVTGFFDFEKCGPPVGVSFFPPRHDETG